MADHWRDVQDRQFIKGHRASFWEGSLRELSREDFQLHGRGFDINPDFVGYSNIRARELGLESRVRFAYADINNLEVAANTYDLGACLGAFYIFRENGWRVLARAVKPDAYLAISDMVCKRVPAPKELADVYFEEQDQPLTLDDARRWYTSRGARIIREETCSLRAWLEYYDLTGKMLLQISKRNPSNKDVQLEVEEGLIEERLFRKYGEQYVDYVTFIMKI